MSAASAAAAAMSDARIQTISSILNLCERATINMEREGIANAVKAIIIICMKFVDKEALFKAVLPGMYIDWEYVRAQLSSGGGTGSGGASGASSQGKKNLLGDSQTWLHMMQFLNFGEATMPERVLQMQHPTLSCMHAATTAAGAGKTLKFDDVSKLLILNNIEGLTSKMMIELYTSSRLNCNTHAICSGKAAFSFLALSCHICQTSTLTHAICSGEAAFPFLALPNPEAEQNNNFSPHTHTYTCRHRQRAGRREAWQRRIREQLQVRTRNTAEGR